MLGGIQHRAAVVFSIVAILVLAGCQIQSKSPLVGAGVVPVGLPDAFRLDAIAITEADKSAARTMAELSNVTYAATGGGAYTTLNEDGSGYSVVFEEMSAVKPGLFVAQFDSSGERYYYQFFSLRDGVATFYPATFAMVGRWLGTGPGNAAAKRRIMENPPPEDGKIVTISTRAQLEDWARFAANMRWARKSESRFRVVEVDADEIAGSSNWEIISQNDVITGEAKIAAVLRPVPGEADAASQFFVECDRGGIRFWLVSEGRNYRHEFPDAPAGGVLVEMRVNDSEVARFLFSQGLAPGDAHVPTTEQAIGYKLNMILRPDLEEVTLIDDSTSLVRAITAADRIVLRVHDRAGTPMVSMFEPRDTSQDVLRQMNQCG